MKINFKPGDVVMRKLTRDICVVIEMGPPSVFDSGNWVLIQSFVNGNQLRIFEEWLELIHRFSNEEC